MLWWMLQTSVVAAALAMVVAIVCRLGRLRPAVQHALWLVVLLKLATPNVVQWPWSVAEVAGQLRGNEEPLADDHRDLETHPAPDDRSARHDISSTGVPGRPAVNDMAGSGDPAITEATAARSTELTEEERELVQRVLVPEVGSPGVREDLGETREVERTAGAVSAGLRPPLAEGTPILQLDAELLLIAIWACGAAVYLVRTIRRIVQFRRNLLNSNSVPDWLQQSVWELSAELRVRPPRLLVAQDVASPCLWCLGSPLLVWPERLADDPEPVRWRGIIVHELAHLRRRDHWVAWLELFVGGVWWWNPLYWLARRQIRETADLACDAWAVWMIADGQRAYAESLLDVTQRLSRMPAAAPLLGASNGTRRSYQRRIEMIMSSRVPCRAPKLGLLCAGLLAMLSVPAWSLDGPTAPDATNPTNNPLVQSSAAADASTDPKPAFTSPRAAESGPSPRRSENDFQPRGRSDAVSETIPEPKLAPEKLTAAERLERLERQIQSLVDELRAIRASGEVQRTRPQGPANAEPSAPPKWLPALSPDGKLLAVATRGGPIEIVEAATGKQIRVIDLGIPLDPLAILFDPTGNVLRVLSDQKSWRIDITTGKVLSFTTHDVTRSIQTAAGGFTLPPTAADAGTSLPASADQSAASTGGLAQSLAGAQIDLIRLATEYTDAVGEKKIAERKWKGIQALINSNVVPQTEAVTTEVQYEAASNKVALLRAIAEAAAEATKGELEFSERMVEKGYATPASVSQIKAKLRIISLILDGGTKQPSEPLPTY